MVRGEDVFENPVVAGEDVVDRFRVGFFLGETVVDVYYYCMGAKGEGVERIMFLVGQGVGGQTWWKV